MGRGRGVGENGQRVVGVRFVCVLQPCASVLLLKSFSPLFFPIKYSTEMVYIWAYTTLHIRQLRDENMFPKSTLTSFPNNSSDTKRQKIYSRHLSHPFHTECLQFPLTRIIIEKNFSSLQPRQKRNNVNGFCSNMLIDGQKKKNVEL